MCAGVHLLSLFSLIVNFSLFVRKYFLCVGGCLYVDVVPVCFLLAVGRAKVTAAFTCLALSSPVSSLCISPYVVSPYKLC